QTLSAASRTTVPVGKSGSGAVELTDDLLRLHRHLVFRSPGEVDQLLGMIECKLAAAADMPGIRRRSGIPRPYRVRHCGVADNAGPAPVAHRLELAVPSSRWKPDFDLDIRIGRRSQGRRDAAERWKVLECIPIGGVLRSGWRHELTCRNQPCRGDRGVFQRERCQLIAWRGKRRNRGDTY